MTTCQTKNYHHKTNFFIPFTGKSKTVIKTNNDEATITHTHNRLFSAWFTGKSTTVKNCYQMISTNDKANHTHDGDVLPSFLSVKVQTH